MRFFIFFLLILAVGPGSPVSFGAEKVLRHALAFDISELSSLKAVDNDCISILGHTTEGLTRFTDKGDVSIKPGVAERWELRPMGATFHLRKNAKWSDGKPVRAQDFVFGWQKVADPQTASNYAFIMYHVKNGEAITTGKLPPSALGVSAPDDYTLVVEYERPCPYFIYLTALWSFDPIREDFYRAQGALYASGPDKMLYNGPFMLASWQKGASLSLVRNPQYWNPSLTKLDRIEIPYITPDPLARFNLFQTGKIDTLLLIGKETFARMQKEHLPVLTHRNGSITYAMYNFRPRPSGKLSPFTNRNLRKAASLAFRMDYPDFINHALGIPGVKPINTFVTAAIMGLKRPFNAEYPYVPEPVSVAKLNAYLAAAKKDFGGALPDATLLLGDSVGAAKEGEFIQNMFRRRLGMRISLDKQVEKQIYAKLDGSDFDMGLYNWGPDYPDAMTDADVFASWDGNNRGHWTNAKYDELIRAAQNERDSKKRLADLAESQRILLDDSGIQPMSEDVVLWAESPRTTGVIRRIFGPDPDFTYADVK